MVYSLVDHEANPALLVMRPLMGEGCFTWAGPKAAEHAGARAAAAKPLSDWMLAFAPGAISRRH